ncbi:RSP_7527 family protein [Marinomonas transparens]|uniref:Uncharacterized protein n=1 Tax=Marinomonas transparens TaxID=2795388 RepID=A0A934N1L5_9GAMM|nr:hypothetical protein [Marinomonas transparens]MBJ7537877.1 hypothetical protein [Marinomonas transparens]
MKNDYKYDAFGNLDTDYYVEQAYALRSAYYTEMTKKTIVAIKAFFANLTANRSFKTAQQS